MAARTGCLVLAYTSTRNSEAINSWRASCELRGLGFEIVDPDRCSIPNFLARATEDTVLLVDCIDCDLILDPVTAVQVAHRLSPRPRSVFLLPDWCRETIEALAQAGVEEEDSRVWLHFLTESTADMDRCFDHLAGQDTGEHIHERSGDA